MATELTTQRTPLEFHDEIARFLQLIESLSSSYPFLTAIAQRERDAKQQAFEDFLEKNATKKEGAGDRKHYTLPVAQAMSADRLRRQSVNAVIAETLLQRSYLTSLVSQYDSFLGRLIRLV